ncbi:DUF11 domain-containing protein [Leucobacter coleopterorum]|uniref:DUF11 domain-containing protein n=1 Tax=Leucobacter coleopterorum TaxID=2714933 RepID=A0ABX6JVF5_9MICO|nr:VWA domain-containing protein [Leucobacter coleopterorum]QIM17543.1 DUF11 domain-containing protein [Leucobacter coleopterorum]
MVQPPGGDQKGLFRPKTIAALVLTPALAFGLTLTDMGGVLAAQAVDESMTTVPADNSTSAAKTTAQDQTTPPGATTPTETTPPADPADTPKVETPAPTDPATPTDTGTDPTAEPTPAPEPKVEPKAGKPAAKAAASEAVITPLSVPAPTTSTSVITVKVGGDRTTLTSIAPLAGVTLRLYNGGAGGPDANPRPEAWATCVSDADGDCSFTIPDTQNAGGGNPAGVNRNARFWIKQSGVPSGFFANNTIATGTSPSSTAYQFRTGSNLLPNTTYTSTVDFMIASGSTNNQASGGVWQNSRNNPAFPQQCGLSVALIMDLSGSVSPYVSQLRTAAKGFVDALTGTPSEMALYTFANVAPAPTGANLTTTAVSTAAGATTVKNRIDTYTAGGTTNWDRGIFQAVGSPTIYDVAIVLTDGNPTVYAGAEGPGDRTRFREVENGIFSANALKAQGTKIIAFGVGDGVGGSPDNLRAISGPVANDDYYQTDDYATAGATLRQLALGNCAGSISVVKQVVPSGNTGENITGATPESGWNFTASTTTTGVSPASQSGATDGTGAVNFPLSYSGGTTTGTVKVAEAQQPGYTLVTQGGKRAVCTNIATGAGVTVTNDAVDPNAFSVDAPATAAISCRVYNRAPQPLASLVVDKTWVVNGVTYADGNQPIGIDAQLQLGGTNQAWGNPRTGLVVGSNLAISETTTFTGRDLCTLTDSKITEQNGSTVSLAVPYNATIAATNTYMLTNTVTCTSELTLVKQVQGGNADPTSWTLDAVAPGGALPGPNGASGSPGATALVTPNISYPLAESGGSPLYTQSIIQGGNPQPPSTGSWSCVQINSQGQVVPGFADGINGAVIVPLGFKVRCTAVNRTASLNLVKQVVNDDGGSRVPADWSLTATPTGTFPVGLVAQTVAGNVDGETISVRPGTTYNLSESSLAGYSLSSLKCDVGPDGTFVDATSVSVPALGDVTCIFVNDDQKATLSLVKVVDNGTSGATTSPSAWTLTAEGPDTVTGAGNSPEVTSQQVTSGVYDLSEAGGPAGYTASDWSCTGAETSDESSVTLTPGENATCTITNTAVRPVITLEKEVLNTHGGKRTDGEFSLSATGGSTVGGFSGTPEVTAVPVPIGTYDLSEINIDPLGYSLEDLVCENRGVDTGTTVADPTVTLGLGDNVVCTFTNEDLPATITLIKDVEANSTGSTKVPADWTLTATPSNITGQDPVTGNGTGVTADGGVQSASIFAGDYTLSESGPSGFDAGDWVCDGGVVDDGVVTVPNGGNVICTITNTAVSPKLTLIKNVDNGDTDGDAVPRDWTLTAQGPTPISGKRTDPSITGANVQVGAYDLSEAGTATGYTAGSWTCDGGQLTGSTVTLAEGDDVTCQITNTAAEQAWTVEKSSSPASGSTVLPGGTVTYTVTATHTAGVDPDDILITDDLSDVLDDATLQGTPTASVGTATLNGTTLEWSMDTLTGTATVTYTVKVNDDAWGATLHNVVTPPEGSTCVGDCETTHYTPKWQLTKSSDPADGSVVDPGSTITYTLHAKNISKATVTGATALDSLLSVLDEADLVQPLDPSLVYDPDAKTLRWNVPTMVPDAQEVTVSYKVTIKPDSFGETILNVVTPFGGGECPIPEIVLPDRGPTILADGDDCDTTERVRDVNLTIAKTHDPIPEVAVDAGKGDKIDYNLVVTNKGKDPASAVVVTDTLPTGLTYVDGTLEAPDGWTAEVVDGVFTATFEGPFDPEATAEFAFEVSVGDLPRANESDPYAPIINTACVSEGETDSDMADNCASDTTPVKTIAVTADAVCVKDTPIASYSVTPTNLQTIPKISLIWWTKDAYEKRDPTIDASDAAALLADGASQVDPIEVPVGWTNGTKIEGQILWPGAAVDADGNPIAWPGWTELPDGTWILDPNAPFYNLRGEAVMEIRINPSSSAVLVYPPATPNCAAQPPQNPPKPPPGPNPPGGTPGNLPRTGAEANMAFAGGVAILTLLGALVVLTHRRRRDHRGDLG